MAFTCFSDFSNPWFNFQHFNFSLFFYYCPIIDESGQLPPFDHTCISYIKHTHKSTVTWSWRRKHFKRGGGGHKFWRKVPEFFLLCPLGLLSIFYQP